MMIEKSIKFVEITFNWVAFLHVIVVNFCLGELIISLTIYRL